MALARRNDPLAFDFRQGFDVRFSVANKGCADEDGVYRHTGKLIEVQVGLEAIDLASEGVALDFDIHQAQGFAVEVRYGLGHDDHAGAGAPNGVSSCEGPYGLQEAVHRHQSRYRRTFATGDDQRVESRQICRQAYLPRFCSQARDDGFMLREVAL